MPPLSLHHRPAGIEILENRIAPALFFLSSNSLHVLDSKGNIVDGSADGTGAALSITLAKGDSLVYDVNNNHTLDSGDPILVSVTAGSCLLFATDLGSQGYFVQNDLTGMAVSTGFQATINTDINGSIVTALNSTGAFTGTGGQLPVQHSTIAGITINGQVVGNILAGGSINNLSVATQQYNTGADQRSVTGDIAAGTAVNDTDAGLAPVPVSFNGGATTFTLGQFTQPAGVTGGGINNVRLANAAANILAGNGGNASSGAPGNGGHITNLITTVGYSSPMTIMSGTGGSFSGAAGNGGGGGAIIGLNISTTTGITGSLEISAGAGGNGAGTGSGGAGGGIINDTFISNGFISGTFLVAGGTGGGAGAGGFAGAGGGISGTVVQALRSGIGSMMITGGTGGSAPGGYGGAGGSVISTSFTSQAALGDGSQSVSFSFTGGTGGAGQLAGGHGGGLSLDSISHSGDIDAIYPGLIAGGNGGAVDFAKSQTAPGGAGGSVNSITVAVNGNLTSGLACEGGQGGTPNNGVGLGGTGGGILDISMVLNGSGSLLVAGGAGGSSVGAGSGGAGGSLLGVNLLGTAGGTWTIQSGAGGTGTVRGGTGGSVVQASINNSAALTSFSLNGGAGGSAPVGGAGGAISRVSMAVDGDAGFLNVQGGLGGSSKGEIAAPGGALANILLKNLGSITGSVSFTGGRGGSNTTSDRPGGAGGPVSQLTIDNTGGIAPAGLAVTGGAGGNASFSGAGGSGGGVTQFTLDNLAALQSVAITGGSGGTAGSVAGDGGSGGAITGFNISDYFGAIPIQASGGNGGTATANVAGHGGAVDGGTLAGLNSDILLIGGMGGQGSRTANGGVGGGVSSVIGSAGTLVLHAGAGGNSVRTAGAGGSISSVDISAIGQFVRELRAGDGGSGAVAGQGGSVSAVTVAGYIGDFSADFGVNSDTAGMGGIVAGIRGTGAGAATNGSIRNITADGIAAMLAGAPAANAVGYGNGAYTIAGIKASVIGADVNGNGVFDFTPGGINNFYTPDDAHDPTDGDTALDGFVLVRAGGLSPLPVTPLKLIEI